MVKVRRVVTGHSPEGKAIVAEDSEVDGITLDLIPGYEFHRVWGQDAKPTFPDDGREPVTPTYFPPVDGTRFAIFTVPPAGLALPEDLDLEGALAEMEEALPGMAGHMEPDNPGMHTTDTIDYLYVASGSATLELDDGATVEVRAGDTIIQNGTRHRWRNDGSEPCVLAVVLVGAHRT